jgi:hypothetical protein
MSAVTDVLGLRFIQILGEHPEFAFDLFEAREQFDIIEYDPSVEKHS